ncbi:MAG: hypothetical protein KBT11_07465 [Treponema sp.]|nr:hypothetical protein [Candidatus Treponema equifaecale]
MKKIIAIAIAAVSLLLTISCGSTKVEPAPEKPAFTRKPSDAPVVRIGGGEGGISFN